MFSDLCGLDHQIVVASLLSAWLSYALMKACTIFAAGQ